MTNRMRDRQDFIAIPTFNRVRNLFAFSTCLQQVRGLERYRVFVRDDASTEFGADEVALLLPQAESIKRNEVNVGPDASHVRLFRDCIEAGARRIIVLDSDMILSPSLLEAAERLIERTDGFLGLYNSVLHRKRRDVDCNLIEKWSAGGAATCWEAETLKRVIDHYARSTSSTWDAFAVADLRETQKRVLVSRRSYAQHLGIIGANNGTFGHIDYGYGFVVETADQAHFMAETFDRMMSNQDRFIQPEPKRGRLARWLDAMLRGRS
jgi:hypothetical protein